jgi:chromate transporter
MAEIERRQAPSTGNGSDTSGVGGSSSASSSTAASDGAVPPRIPLRALVGYFLKLGAFGFGGPIALAGYMQRDLQEERKWITRDEYQDGLAIAQTMPGPLAAQLAMWIGYIRGGVLGATAVGVAFVLPPFLIVTAVAALYVALEGLSLIRALFYGIGPAAIAIIVLAAWKLAKSTDRSDPKLWGTSAVVMTITVVTHSELAWLFILAGILGITVYAPPWRGSPTAGTGRKLTGLLPFPLANVPALTIPAATAGTLALLTLFFLKASLFTFGSGLAIVPFLYQGVVADYHWLNDRQFLDAVAMGIITPGPVVITATFIGYLVGGVPGAVLASFAVFFPVWVFNVVIGRIFLAHRQNTQVRAFVKGATAAAVGAIAGAAVILGEGAILDLITGGIFVAALAVLYFKKLKEPYVVGLAGLIGALAFHG